MDAIELLTADHNRVRGLFARFREAHEGKDDVTAIEVAGKIFDELKVHTTIEEEVFYPAVHDASEEIGETVDEGLEEHHVVETLMEELGQVEPAGDEWNAKMTVLIENVEHHAEEEEKEAASTPAPLPNPLIEAYTTADNAGTVTVNFPSAPETANRSPLP